MTRRRTRTKRTRKRKNKGTGGINLPNRNTRNQTGEEKSMQVLRDIHEMRSRQAQITDEALKATIAPTPEHWIKQPQRYDLPGIDYPETQKQETKQTKKHKKPNLKQLKELYTEAIPDKPTTNPRTGKQPQEHWLPSTLEKELINEWNRPEEEKTGVALVKYFTPDGNATWYFSEYSPEHDAFYGWCDLGLGYPELGYASRNELRELKGKMGLPVERDYYYEPTPLNTLQGKTAIPDGYESLKEKKQRNHTITHQKGAKWEPHQNLAQPYVLAINHPEAALLESTESTVTLTGMDPSHITLLKITAPNTLDIPEGTYQQTEYHHDKRSTVYKYPKNLQWEPKTNKLSISNDNQQSNIQYKKTNEPENNLPKPKINYTAKATINLTKLHQETTNLLKTIQQDEKPVLKLAAKSNKLTYSNLDNSKSINIGVIKDNKDNPESMYDANILENNINRLAQAGYTEATIEWTQDMPLHITAKKGNGAYTAEYYQAPVIGV